MITKILFTALIVIGVILYVRYRAEARRSPAERSRDAAPGYWRLIPAALLLVLAAVAAIGFWLEWHDEHKVFTVRVIDTRSGEVQTYAVYRSDVHGRRFRTVDGRLVTLADVERMEIIEGDPGDPADSAQSPAPQLRSGSPDAGDDN